MTPEQKSILEKERHRLRKAYEKRAPAPPKGHVEMFMVHDEGYHAIYLDGQHVEDTADKYARIHTYPLSGSWRRSLAEQAGVAEDELRFSYSTPCHAGLAEDVEPEDLTYDMMVQWRGEYPGTFDFHAIDLGSLEDRARSGQF